jgi:1,4-dihydroxy-2-naphthoate octaprenyltransferase
VIVIIWLIYSHYISILLYSIIWLVTIILYVFGGLSKHWIGKNHIFDTMVNIIMFGSMYTLATSQRHESILSINIPMSVCITIVQRSLLYGILFHIQDFKDIKGDSLSNRKTLPVALGDEVARMIMVISLVITAIWFISFFHSIFDYISALLLIHTSYRLHTLRNAHEDRITYNIFVLAYLANVATFGKACQPIHINASAITS